MYKLLQHRTAVLDFWRTFGEPIPGCWENSDSGQRRLYANLIAEEFNELLAARRQSVDELDAYCDLLYVALGGNIACGIGESVFQTNATTAFEPFQRTIGAAHTELVKEPPCQQLQFQYLPRLAATVFENGHALYQRFDDAFMCVHNNNMGKQWTAAEIADLPADLYVAKYRSPKVVEDERLYVVRRKSDNKIVKPPNFVAVKLINYL